MKQFPLVLMLAFMLAVGGIVGCATTDNGPQISNDEASIVLNRIAARRVGFYMGKEKPQTAAKVKEMAEKIKDGEGSVDLMAELKAQLIANVDVGDDPLLAQDLADIMEIFVPVQIDFDAPFETPEGMERIADALIVGIDIGTMSRE